VIIGCFLLAQKSLNAATAPLPEPGPRVAANDGFRTRCARRAMRCHLSRKPAIPPRLENGSPGCARPRDFRTLINRGDRVALLGNFDRAIADNSQAIKVAGCHEVSNAKPGIRGTAFASSPEKLWNVSSNWLSGVMLSKSRIRLIATASPSRSPFRLSER